MSKFKRDHDHNKIGGKLQHHFKFWSSITNDLEALQYVKGLKIPFEVLPPRQSKRPHKIKLSKREENFVDSELKKLLKNGSIKVCNNPPSDGWFSPIFCVPKGKSHRLIVNLKILNLAVKYRRFKLNSIPEICALLEPGMYLARFDWSQCFNHIAIHESHHKYLLFEHKGVSYQYIVAPNGLASIPYQVNRLCRPLMSLLRRKLINCVLYIDDSLIFGMCWETMVKNVQTTLDIYAQAGFTVNMEKSVLTPVQQITFLGFVFDTVEFSIAVSREKRMDLLDLIDRILKSPRSKITIRYLGKIIGKIIAMFPASLHAQLHYRILDRYKVEMLVVHKQNWSAKIALSHNCLKQLTWWKSNMLTDKLKKSLHTRVPEEKLYCDSCGKSWGAVLNGKTAQSYFTVEQQKLCINTKELLAVYYGLQCHLSDLKSKCVLIFSDNFTTVQTIKKKSSRNKLRDKIVGKIYELIFDNNMEILISHIKGTDNFLADVASRSIVMTNKLTEFSCHKDTVKIIKSFPEFKSTIDLFSSHLNHILPIYASLVPCPGAFITDCFNLCWSDFVGFLHPPPRLIPRCLQKIEQDKVPLIKGIFPVRPSAPWWVNLVRHMASKPILLPKNTAKKLLLLWDHSVRHPLWRTMCLFFVSLSASCYVKTRFQKELLNILLNLLGETALRKRCALPPGDGLILSKKKK